MLFFLFCATGALISLTIACTVVVAGPLALNITGVIKDVFLTYAGFIFFDDTKATPFVLVGLAVSFLGAIKTIVHKYYTSKEKAVKDDKAQNYVKETKTLKKKNV